MSASGRKRTSTYEKRPALGGPSSATVCLSYKINISASLTGAPGVTVIGNIAPDGDRDWYGFTAVDVPEGSISLDSFKPTVRFVDNPGGEFRIAVLDSGFTPLCGTQF